jgi:hypothetical protein
MHFVSLLLHHLGEKNSSLTHEMVCDLQCLSGQGLERLGGIAGSTEIISKDLLTR